ncbi:MAG: bifunctional isocitrate dehydrogenase kinase/phosphatase [gamma proteobacterium symbiont of Ctena orbiculata]|uniref:Isocitrate dehydrogenase kinase/phosphatase n=1 Tax=Candidatus Thiodiazotropha taylori TaxID=2792791 RepID=A0A944M539_9GAMM|nr:bifunctional isocitrate dehydrogenase kinase/phosphatase [Candidatus Thiodiazotropha taylori]PUB85760.1 MAG: bifunctional isocitrate dehydrogenase kinase/phosphatase [gamma proteobacterium symbiont of Ctena orbiculata]MBT2988181.1 bifunctional isocitrate dehydrogenase kinase/phosphatase [Candidatus Thiodiazotropha taylori]MBT2996078.1 bifunctional isocitrate dehydrogenase kinase/phosphatase [Candidatus Thiodiazotropha taylori]MBT2999778.1 bifunctional isocitrate dehydrogenase kinase/phosphat
MQNHPRQIAQSILTGFERHFSFFQEISSAARQRFELADWEAVREASAKRINFYDLRVQEAISRLRSNFDIDALDEGLWQQIKQCYADTLRTHSRPELAETFYNSVFCRLFERKYYDNDKIFIESQVDRGELSERYRVYMSFHVAEGGLTGTIWDILSAFYFSLPYEDIKRDCDRVAQSLLDQAGFDELPSDLRFDLLESPFYRNKAAYIIGRMVYGDKIRPFILPLINNEDGGLYVDTLLIRGHHVEAVFSFARAYFMAKTPVPAATVEFLHSIMPYNTLAELYNSIGFHKQAKNEFYRDLLNHLQASEDLFVTAAGTPGMVMQVFTLPSFPYVFKVIRDRFPPQKEVTHKLVKERYFQVKKHDRIGRMADTLDFVDVALPMDRIEPSLLKELKDTVASQLEYDGDMLVIRHIYIERRMVPLNLYIQDADETRVREILDDWGMGIKQLMGVNIFPGDLLFKNFGVNCQGKVVFYDYDEICYLSEVNFRKIPPPRSSLDLYRDEPWYSINPNDVFPEEFITFLTTDAKIRKMLVDLHPELFDYSYWRQAQENLAAGIQADVFPYPQRLRFQRPDSVQAETMKIANMA